MNLKYFYYRGYFKDIDFKQAKKDVPLDKDKNAKVFRENNHTLTKIQYVDPYSPPNELKNERWKEIQLRVQNPGLLPGIGYPHEVGYAGEFKLGFGFDHVNGLPVLPGSSVKGVLRSVFPQFKFDAEQPASFIEEPDPNKADKKKMQTEKAKYTVGLLRRLELAVPAESELEKVKKLAHQLDLAIFCGFNFEKEGESARLPMSKHDVFFDALPVHFEENLLLGRDALTPHGDNPLKNPIPLPFLKVMPGVVFGFYFRLQDSKIGSLTITAEHKRRLFAEILCTVGAGAKTNVGYGQFDAMDAADRIPKPAKSAAIASQIHETAVAANQSTTAAAQPILAVAAKPKMLPFNKSLRGKNIIGEVLRIAGSEIWFRVTNVTGFEGEVSDKNPSANRLEVGKQYELSVNEVNPDKGILKAKIASLKPVN